MNEFLKKAFDLEKPLTFDEAWDITKHEDHAFEKFAVAIFTICMVILRAGYLILKAVIEWALEFISAIKIFIMAFKTDKEES